MLHKTRQGAILKTETIHQIFMRLNSGFTEREVSANLGVARSTVIKYKLKLKQTGHSLQEACKLSPVELSRLLCEGVSSHPSRKTLPDFKSISLELQSQKGVTLDLLWQEYVNEAGMNHAYSYSHFCELYKEHCKGHRLVLRRLFPAGERLFVDFGGLCIPWYHKESKTQKKAQIFVAVLGFSNLIYARACESQTRDVVMRELIRMFEFLNGSPQAVVVDNFKAVVDKACRYDPQINPTLELLANHYNTSIVATAPRSPTHKAKVEVGVQIVQRFIQARFRKRIFTSIQEINQEIASLLPALNQKIMRGYEKSRQELFCEYEQNRLQPLPTQPFEIEDVKTCRVGHDYHFQYDKVYYSVPYFLIGEVVSVRKQRHSLLVFHRGECVARHCTSKRVGDIVTNSEHRPEAHQAVLLNWPAEKLLKYARSVGPFAYAMSQKLIDKAPYPELASRAVLARLHFYKTYGRKALESCIAFLGGCGVSGGSLYKVPRVREIASYLKRNFPVLKGKSQQVCELAEPALNRENLRGREYYQNYFEEVHHV